jgi:ubiquinone/menaquinone biosynthesis C-methylase UbiE
VSGGFDPAGFRDVDRAGDAAAFSANLDRATSVAAIARNRELVRESLALGPGDHLLDVGCGNGEEVRAAAALVGDGGRAVGLDLSEALVAEAVLRTPSGTRNVEFVVGDAHALPFSEGSFDAVRTERTLQHVADPDVVARQMLRVLRCGGRLAAWEPDWGLAFVDSPDGATTAAVLDRVSRAARNPRIGRALARHFREAGLGEVFVLPRVGLFSELAVADERLHLTRHVQDGVADGTVESRQAEAWLDGLREADAAGSFLAGVCGFVVGGRKLV